MAKHRKSRSPRQAKHKKSGKHSRHDRSEKRARLERRNRKRKATKRARFPLVGFLLAVFGGMAKVLDRRMESRLLILLSGMLLAGDRCTVSAWLVAAGVLDDWDRFYDLLIRVGLSSQQLATRVLVHVAKRFVSGPGSRILLGIDDTATRRYGRHVEGAGVHHNPTPGPGDGDFMYGHNWVTLAWLAGHPTWGVIALPLWSLLYVRESDVPELDRKRGWEFRTKLQLAAELVKWTVTTLRANGFEASVWVVCDGAYAKRPLLTELLALGVTVVSRLRKDAKLFDLPNAPTEKRRGRPRIYGENKINLAKRAAHPEGWKTIAYLNRGVEVTQYYKTFQATSQLVGGVIRVVILKYDDGVWAPYFCTDPNASVKRILEDVGARWAMEEHFHDIKETCGAGEQQVRNVWSNIGCWNLQQWLFTMVELACWDRSAEELVDRSDRAWDNPHRRPSHADKRRAICREMLGQEFKGALARGPDLKKIKQLATNLFALCL